MTALAAGRAHSVALKADGAVWAWGYNGEGELGNGSSGADAATPVQVSGLTGVVAVTVGGWHSLALKSDGTVWAWGRGGSGQLGNGSTANSSAPVQVSGLTGVVAVAAGDLYSVALKSDGTVWTWGDNSSDQLGVDPKNVASRSTPGQVSGLSGVTAVGAANIAAHALALKSDGTVWAWGGNFYGQLGNGTSGSRASSYTPLQVSGLSGVTAVAASGQVSLALKPDGTVWHWGFIGDCSPTCYYTTPVQVAIGDVVAIAAGADHAVAIRRGGTVWTWGGDADGQQGRTPGGVGQAPGVSGAVAIAAGVEFTLAAGNAPPTSNYTPPPSPPADQNYGSGAGYEGFAPIPQSMQSDPVNSATGSFTSSTTDAALPGIGVGLSYTRTYNSQDGTGTPELGPGWSGSFSDKIAVDPPTGNVTLHSGSGQVVRFTRNPDGSFIGTYGATATLVANGDGTFTLTSKQHLRYVFSATGQLTSETDLDGQGLAFTYDSTTHLLASMSGVGRTVTVNHDPTSGRLTQLTLSDGRYVAYSYTGGLLTDVRGLDGNHTSFGYDAGTRLASIQDANGHYIVRNTYDSTTGRVVDQQDANGQHTTFAWDPASQTQTMTDPRGRTWKDSYAGTVLLSQTNPLGQTTRFQYDAAYRLARTIDPAGNVTTESYDTAGNLVSEVTPDGATYSYGYDALGDQTSSTTPTGTTVTYSYNQAGQLIGTSRPNPAGGTAIVTTITRNTTTGLITAATDARGKTTQYSYDAQGNKVSQTSPLGEVTTWTYDASGRITSVVEPRGNVTGANPDQYRTRYTYDGANRVLTLVDALGKTAQSNVYDPVGNLTSRTDAKLRTTTWTYTASNKPATMQPPAPIGATAYSYDPNDNLASVTAPGNRVTSYTYDDADRMASGGTPLGTWTFAYDTAGNRKQVTSPSGQSATMAYDGMHHVTSINYFSNTSTPSVAYGYNLDGTRTLMTDGSGTVQYGHDSLGQLTSVNRGSSTFSYTYDVGGNVTSRTTPGQPTNTYTYDDDDRLAAVSTAGVSQASYAYDPAGHVTSANLADGSSETRAYDNDGRLTGITAVKGSTTLDQATYTLDATGNPTAVVDAVGTTTTYTYDVLDRLTAACFNSTTCTTPSDYIRYSYGDTGLRLTETRPAGTTTYTYNSKDQLTQTSGPNGTTSFGYDSDGNQTTTGATTFTFNAAGRMLSRTAGTATTAYTYDGDGRRLTATTGNTTTNFLWDPLNYNLAAETDSSGNTLHSYTYGTGLVDMTIPGNKGGTFYYHTDAQGSPLSLTDATGARQWSYQWEPYGSTKAATQIASNAPANPRQWLGEYAENGQYHLRARQYDPTTGQFTSPDQGGSSSAYGYASDNPLINTDPLGQFDLWGALDVIHSAAQITASVVGIAAVACAATVVCAPVDAVLGPVAAGAAAVAAGTGIALAVHACTSPKGSCAKAVTVAALDTVGAASLGIGSLAGRGAEAVAGGGTLPDDALVVRGGTNTVDRFAGGSGVTRDTAGNVYDVSVNSAPGRSIEELSAGIRNKQIGVTTVGEIRQAGGSIQLDPLEDNPYHCLIGGCTPEQFSELFTPTIKNPAIG